jgi:predicted RND superfamily exporter protein
LFAILILGNFLLARQIGGLIALIVVAALVTDLLFLPAMLRLLPAGAFKKFLRVET